MVFGADALEEQDPGQLHRHQQGWDGHATWGMWDDGVLIDKAVETLLGGNAPKPGERRAI